jgi:glycosyltransferase involved in cell wall biosynthesis
MNEQDWAVSVIIPTKNRPDRIERAVGSVFDQRCLPQEIIIVDDASSVSYKAVVADLRERSPVPLIYHKHESPTRAGAARNTGARLAQGDILMFLDDDDAWLPEKICGQLHVFSDRPEVGLVYAGRRVVNDQGELLYTIEPNAEGDISSVVWQKNPIGTTSSVAIRDELFWRVGGFDPGMPALQDYDLWIRLAPLTRVGFDPDCTVEWTIHDAVGGQMGSQPQIYEQAVDRLCDKYSKDLAALPSLERRKAYAWFNALIASRYALSGVYCRQCVYAMRSIKCYPLLSVLGYLMPYSMLMNVRCLLGR